MEIIQVIEDLCHGCGACSVACKTGAISEKQVSLGQVSEYSLEGWLAFNPQVVEAMVQGKSITEYNADLIISKKISKIWKKILKQ